MKETKAFRDGLDERGIKKDYILDSSNEMFDHIYTTDAKISSYNIYFSEVYNEGDSTICPTLTISGITADEALEIIDWVMSK